MGNHHSRATDKTAVLLHVYANDCTGSGAVRYLEGLGIRIDSVPAGEVAQWLEPIQGETVVLLGEELLSDMPALAALADKLGGVTHQRLVIVVHSETLTFEQRLRLARLGNVRLFRTTDDLRLVRDLIRDWRRKDAMNGYRVLLVEDSRTDAHLATNHMESVGLEVRHIRDASLVLNEIESFQPDLIISDLHMPGCEGDEMARVIRQDRDATLPIIFLSSEADGARQLHAVASGADGFIKKPLNKEPFILAVQSTIERAQWRERQMRRDPLTGLLNRRQFERTMNRLAERGGECALAILDIDHFKQVNDRHGHPVGDQVICGLAGVLDNGLRSTDYVGRLGGEEFGVLMPGCGTADAVGIIDRLRAGFGCLDFNGATNLPFTCSFSAGVTQLSGCPADAYRLADEALYASKENGRNRVTVRPSHTSLPSTQT